MICLCNKNQKLRTIYINPLNAQLNPICHLLALLGTHHILHVSRIRVNVLIILSSLCFEHRSVNPQEDLYMQFYGISFMHPYRQSRLWQNVHPACTGLPEDEHLNVRNI